MNKLSALYKFIFGGRFTTPIVIKILEINNKYIVYNEKTKAGVKYYTIYDIKNKNMCFVIENENPDTMRVIKFNKEKNDFYHIKCSDYRIKYYSNIIKDIIKKHEK